MAATGSAIGEVEDTGSASKIARPRRGYRSVPPRHRERRVALRMVVASILLLIALLYVLIFLMNNARHFAPQAFYRKKRGGAPVAEEFESLGPRPRRPPPSEDAGKL
jgi:hypothetical protein